jgi:CBS domain-containing membrane protein
LALGALIGILIIGVVSEYGMRRVFHNQKGILFSANGASAALLFGAEKSPLAQPKNFIWGHISATSVSFVMFNAFPRDVWYLAAAFAVGISLFIFHITELNNPPSVALALLFVTSADVQAIGYWYILSALLSAFILMFVAIILENVFKFYKYPTHWRII